jgi:hypothetical protein
MDMHAPRSVEEHSPRLVRFVLEPDGATMSCHYCEGSTSIGDGEVPRQILRFQEAHFDCDPALAAALR